MASRQLSQHTACRLGPVRPLATAEGHGKSWLLPLGQKEDVPGGGGCPGGGGMAVRGARLPGASCRPLLGTPGSRLSEMVMVILLLPCVDAVPTLNRVCYK